MPRFWRWFWVVVLGVPVAAFTIWGLVDNAKLFCTTALNGLTLAALYFLVASGFTLVFGLMRNVNLAHGSLYLLGAYVGYMVGDKTGSWLLAVAAGFASAALFGLVLQVTVFRFMQGQDLRQALISNDTALAAWKDITPLARNEFICWVEDAKQEKTRERRIRRTQEELEEGMRRPCCWPGCKHRERTGK